MAKTEGDKKYFRILNIISRLNTGPVKTRELAQEFNISVRSVQRDLERINMTGFALDSFQKGVYQFAPGVSLRSLKLSNEQLSVLVLMHGMAAQMGGALKTAFEKIFSQLTRGEGLDSPFHAILQRARQELDAKTQKDLEFAIEHRRKIKILYESPGKKGERELCPLKLIYSDGFFYLLAAKDAPSAAEAFIKYRADRIKKVEILLASFSPPQKKALEKLLDGATSIWGVNTSRRLRVKLRLEGAAVDFFKNKQALPRQRILKETAARVILESSAAHPMEIIPHVLQWLPDITVISPPSLKKEVKDRVTAYLRKAAGKGSRSAFP